MPGKSGPMSPSMSGETAMTMRPWPLTAAEGLARRRPTPARGNVEHGGAARQDGPGRGRAADDGARLGFSLDGVLPGEVVDDHVEDARGRPLNVLLGHVDVAAESLLGEGRLCDLHIARCASSVFSPVCLATWVCWVTRA